MAVTRRSQGVDPLLVDILVPPNALAGEVCGPIDVFTEATLRLAGEGAYEVRVVAESAGPITCASGLRLLPDRTIDAPEGATDTLIVAGPRQVPEAPPSTALTDWIRRRSAQVRRFGSISAGAFLLGAAGLLNGRRVTVHWEFARQLAERYPMAIVNPDRIFERDGALFTSAGATAGTDLALALVEEDFGRDLALAVARFLLLYLKRPGGHPQLSVQLAAQIATRSPIQQILEWVRDHPKAELTVPELARRAGMSERNFSRIFRQDTGMTPADFVEATRVDAARQLLEDTALPLQRIASACGFASPDSLRRAFLRRLGVRPRDYRLRFRASRRADVSPGNGTS